MDGWCGPHIKGILYQASGKGQDFDNWKPICSVQKLHSSHWSRIYPNRYFYGNAKGFTKTNPPNWDKKAGTCSLTHKSTMANIPKRPRHSSPKSSAPPDSKHCVQGEFAARATIVREDVFLGSLLPVASSDLLGRIMKVCLLSPCPSWVKSLSRKALSLP